MDLEMNAYFYSFKPTGVREIDVILSAVAHAGIAFHHTEDWTGKTFTSNPLLVGDSARDWIQNAANVAAIKFKSDMDKLAKQCDLELKLKDGEINCKSIDFNYLIQMLLSCVERAEGIIDGGPITREAEKHVHAWRTRKEGP